MNGGSGAGGRGYDDQGYGDYDKRGQSRPRPGTQPQWGTPGRQQGQSQQGQARQQGRPGGPQQYPRTGPQPGMRGPGPQAGDPQASGPRASGPRPGVRGSGPQQPPPGYEPGYERGYDPRGTGPRRMADGYPPEGNQPRDAQFRQDGYPGWQPGQGDESFLPGFGQDDAGDDRDPRGPREGRGGRYPADYPGDQAAYEDEYDDFDDYDDRARPGRQRAGRGRDDWDGGRQRRPRRGVVRRLAPWVALLVIVAPLLVGGLYVYHIYENKYHPADYSGPGLAPAVTVQVATGDTATSLAPKLAQLGVVASSRAFVLAAEHATNAAGLEAGFYKLNRHMQASLAYQALLNPKNRIQLTLTFPEGLRASQLVALLGARSGIPAGDYRKVLADPAQLGLPSYARGKPEGYLFPATYQIQPNDTALTVLKAMVQRFDQEAAQVKLPGAAASVHMSATQLIVVASLVQAEGGRVKDYPKIARVVYNRLARGMKLQFDSTVFYGLGRYGTAATDAEIHTPGPYNTYMNTGLPPGPIDNPGNAAIEAALRPAPGNWLYFFSFKNGVTEFSPTPIAH